MVTIHRQAGFRVMVFVDDHRPAHVHVVGSGEAKIDLGQCGAEVKLLWAVGMNQAEVRKALTIVAEHREVFLARWRDIHG